MNIFVESKHSITTKYTANFLKAGITTYRHRVEWSESKLIKIYCALFLRRINPFSSVHVYRDNRKSILFFYGPWNIDSKYSRVYRAGLIGAWERFLVFHLWVCTYYDDVIMSAIASQITSLTIVYSTVYPGADQSKHQSSVSLAFVCGIHPAQMASNAENVSIWWRHHTKVSWSNDV